jgi:hypothetical protein
MVDTSSHCTCPVDEPVDMAVMFVINNWSLKSG